MPIGAAIGLAVFALILGAVLGYLISRKVFEKQLKKNPPITEKQIRTMLTMMVVNQVKNKSAKLCAECNNLNY